MLQSPSKRQVCEAHGTPVFAREHKHSETVVVQDSLHRGGQSLPPDFDPVLLELLLEELDDALRVAGLR